MSPQQTALAACCRRSVWCANLIASPHSQTRVQLGCLAPLSGQYATKLPRSTLRPVYNLIAASTLRPVGNQVGTSTLRPVHNLIAASTLRPVGNQVGTSTLAKTRTATRALWAQLLLLPLPMLLASYWLSSTLRAYSFDCSARDWDRIRITWGNPQGGCSDVCSYLKGHYRCTRSLCYQAQTPV